MCCSTADPTQQVNSSAHCIKNGCLETTILSKPKRFAESTHGFYFKYLYVLCNYSFSSSPASDEESSLWFLKLLLPAGLQSFGIERWYLGAKRLVFRLVSSPPPFSSSHYLAPVPAALARAVLQFHVDCRLVECLKSPATPDRLLIFF